MEPEVPFPFSDFPREVDPMPPVETVAGVLSEEDSGPESEE
jgi:hypothetical protein